MIIYLIVISLFFLTSKSQSIITLASNNITACTGNHCQVNLDATVTLDEPEGNLVVVDPYRSINYNLSISNAIATFNLVTTKNFSLIDSTSADQMSCLCPTGNMDITTPPCTVTPLATNLDVTFDIKVSPIPPNDCPATTRSARCCYILKMWSTDYYQVYTGLSATFDHIDVTYHNSQFPLKYGVTNSFLDLNVTMLGMKYDLLPLDSLAVIINSFGVARVINKNLINFPGEYNANKGGWWQQDVDIASTNFPASQMPSNIQGYSQKWRSNLNITQINTLPSYPGITVNPVYSSTPGNRLLSANIVLTTTPSISYYSYQPNNLAYVNLTLTVDDEPRLVCISYPYVCICTPDPTNPTFNPFKRCTSYQGRVMIWTQNQAIGYALIDGSNNLLVDVDANLVSLTFQINPSEINLRVASSVSVPAITLTDTSSISITLYNLSSITSAVFNFSTYPTYFIIETDLQSSYFVISAPGIQNRLNWTTPLFKIIDNNGARLLTIITPPITNDESSSSTSSPLKIFTKPIFWLSLFFWVPFWGVTHKKKILSPHLFGFSLFFVFFLPQFFWLTIPLFVLIVIWHARKIEEKRLLKLEEKELEEKELEEFDVIDYKPPTPQRTIDVEFIQPRHPNDQWKRGNSTK